MKTKAHLRFWDDVTALTSRSVKRQILHFIDDAPEMTLTELMAIYDLKPLREAGFYRLRIEDYRLGCRYDRANDTLLLMRLMHRERIYRSFP